MRGTNGTDLSHDLQSRQIIVESYYGLSYPVSRPVPTITEAQGHSWGGSQTTTHTEYEEHTITEGEAFTTGENWSTAWAQDTVHSADLRFTYRVCNFGADYAREVTGLLFNIYLGDDPNPIHTYNASAQIGTLTNVMPDECHIYTSDPVALTLDEMRAIDLGGAPLRRRRGLCLWQRRAFLRGRSQRRRLDRHRRRF
jgi:hypothetical protein